MSIVTAPQIDDKQEALSHPTYRYNQVFPNTYGQAIQLGAGQVPVQITIPNEVFNWAPSYLSFQITIPAVAANYIWTWENTWSAISHIQHYAQGNQLIVDVDNLQNYMKIVLPKEMSLREFLTLDPQNRFYPNNSLVNVVPALRYSATAGTPAPSSVNYTEPAQLQVGGLNSDVTIQCMLPLKHIRNTAFAIDKNFYYGQNSYLKLFFGPLSKVGYMSASNADPNLGTPTSITSTAVINNLCLFLAVESNTDMRQAIMDKVAGSGLETYIPFVQSYKNSNNSSTQNISITFDIGNGSILQKIIHSVFNNNEALNTAYDCANNASGPVPQKVLQYRTLLNSKPLQDLVLDASAATGIYTDYMQNKQYLKGSVLQNQNVYQYHWHNTDDFTGFGANYDQNNDNHLLSGVRMASVPLTWTFNGSSMTNANYQHYTYAVTTKKLRMFPNLVEVQ